MAYASPYYDPQKAHEYYMRNRQLKGYEHRYDGTDREAKNKSTNINYNQRITNNNESVSSNSSKTKANAESISSQVKALQEAYKSMSESERKANKNKIQAMIKVLRAELKAKNQEYADAVQRERQNSDSTSTSGFNQRGIEAAEYIKSQIEAERDKVNEQITSEMNSRLEVFFQRVNDGYYENKKAMQKDAKRYLNQIKHRRRQLKSQYAQKYKDEIKKLRQDNSMWTYWDKRNAS